MKRKLVEKEHSTAEFDTFNNRYRRASQLIDEKKVSCTLKMRVS